MLSFSNEIADIKNRTDLYEVVVAKIKQTFGIERFSIAKINEDQTTFSAFATDPGYNARFHPDFQTIISTNYPINDPVFGRVIASDDPVLFDIDLLQKEIASPWYVGFWKSIGMRYAMIAALRTGHRAVGFVILNFIDSQGTEAKSTLLKNICPQLAITVAGLIADEKLTEETETTMNPAEIIGDSTELKKLFRLIAQVAYTDSTVLLMGETGTGKELVARAIHSSSPRKSRLMVKVNCAAIPANLIESELFGHERGSFTGAAERRIGKFELAHQSTLFLDEIGELPLELQSKLLRALQEKEIERVGGKTTIRTNARIIAATNRDLERLMEDGKFRSDLYYRLNTFPILIPPLRNRKEDIPKLALYFTERYSKRTGKKIKVITGKVLQELMQYDWPGNIRELEHLIERSVLLATGDSITEILLPRPKRSPPAISEKEHLVIKTLAENEKEHILRVLKYVKGRIGGKGGAAELLGLPTSTLNSKIKKLGIRREHIG